MSTAAKPDGANGGGAPAQLAELPPFTAGWDFEAQRLTLKQKHSELAIHPHEVTITFEALELLFWQLYTVALQSRGALDRAKAASPFEIAHVVPPSGGPSDPPRSFDPRRRSSQ